MQKKSPNTIEFEHALTELAKNAKSDVKLTFDGNKALAQLLEAAGFGKQYKDILCWVLPFPAFVMGMAMQAMLSTLL